MQYFKLCCYYICYGDPWSLVFGVTTAKRLQLAEIFVPFCIHTILWIELQMFNVLNNAWHCQTFNFIFSSICVVVLNFDSIFISVIISSIVLCLFAIHMLLWWSITECRFFFFFFLPIFWNGLFIFLLLHYFFLKIFWIQVLCQYMVYKYFLPVIACFFIYCL